MDLLLAHGDDGSAILGSDADPRSAASVAGPVARRDPRFLADATADANDLVRQGWAVVVPDTADGARLRALIEPLARARADDQAAEVLTIRVPPGMDAAAATEWKRSAYPALYGDEARRPRYLVVLGDLDGVSLDTQQVLARDGLVGRLACASDAGYGAYSDKVLAWQRRPSEHSRARAMFYTVHDGSRATAAGHDKLIRPCHDRCVRAARDDPREFPASAVEVHGAAAPEPDELLALAAVRQPSVLLSLSHGLGPPRRRRWTASEARDLQGAMSFGAEGAVSQAELAAAPFLPGGMWIYFACFGAGTPRTSSYHHWLELLASHGMTELGPVQDTLRGLDEQTGFVSALAKAALGNPDGPLALLGHIDLAWSYSYEELRVDGDRRISGSNRSLNFFHMMAKLVAGERVGAAALGLTLQQAAVGAELTAHYDRCQRSGGSGGARDAAPADALALGNLWMLHQDLAGYAVLGDPAVRLPLGPAASSDRTRAELARGDRRPAVPPVRTPDAASGDVPGDMVDRLERAALAIAAGDSPGAAAAELGMVRSELVEAAELYRSAGRAALAALLARRADPEKGPDR